MRIILPQECNGRKLDLVRLVHPKTREPAKFLIDLAADAPHPLLELIAVGDASRSLLVDEHIIRDGQLVTAIPMHPLFLILDSLFTLKDQAMPLSVIIDAGTTAETEDVPEELVLPYLNLVCEMPRPGVFRLNLDKLKSFLDGRADRIQSNLPALAQDQILKSVQPVDPNQKISDEAHDEALKYAAVSMIMSSWLSSDAASWYFATHDFGLINKLVEESREQRAAQENMMFRNSEPATKRASEPLKNNRTASAKKTKSAPTNNTSILDMFRRK